VFGQPDPHLGSEAHSRNGIVLRLRYGEVGLSSTDDAEDIRKRTSRRVR
jgi:hypothetical protein